MRKKYTSKTYMRGVTDRDLLIIKKNELLEVLNTDSITTEEYNLACNTCTMLIEEIKEHKNIFINMDKKGLIKKYFMWIYNSSNKKHGLMFKYILYFTILRLVWNTTNLFFF